MDRSSDFVSASPPPILHKRWPWFHDRFTFPCVVGVAIALAVGFTSRVWDGATSELEGCSPQAYDKITVGEDDLNLGNFDTAERAANEVLVTEPNCRSAHHTLGKIHYFRYTDATSAQNSGLASNEAFSCFKEERLSVSGKPSPETKSYLKACSVAPVVSVTAR